MAEMRDNIEWGIRNMGKNESKGTSPRVNKMNTATNSQSQKWKKKLET